MKLPTVMNIRPGGRIRAVYDDDYPFRDIGFMPPVRASHVEAIPSGPNAGLWFVDMSPLGESYEYCLYPPFARRDDALAAEREHVIESWVRGYGKEKEIEAAAE